jgi:hypothetical protein
MRQSVGGGKMIKCDNSNCGHSIKTKNGEYCSIPYDNTIHICRFEEKRKEEEE